MRKYLLWALTGGFLLILLIWKALIAAHTLGGEDLWWWFFLIWGTMWSGLVSAPLIKECFPGTGDPRVLAEPARHLKDHETLAGYYPVAAIGIAVAALVLAPYIYGAEGFDALTVIKSPPAFWISAIASGVLNVGLFYFFTKALRYGDLSIVSASQALNPVLALPASFLFYFIAGSVVSDPSVSFVGLVGILIVVAAVAINGFTQKRTNASAPPEHDWFARHPFASSLMSVGFAAVSINFDKLAIDSGNPFAAGVITLGTVALVTVAWTVSASGFGRVRYIFSKYWREFLLVGIVYAGVIITFNLVLYGHNVNYYGAIKRTTVVWSALYGLYVLGEGAGARNKSVRLIVSLAVLLGSFLIIWKG